MRHLRLVCLGLALLLPFGCSSDEEEKTKTDTTKTDKTTENSVDNGKTNQNTPSNNTPNKGMAASGGSVLGMVPQNATLLVSVHPSGLLESQFVNAFPKDDDFNMGMAQMKGAVGFDAQGIGSVSLAIWPGDGNLNQLAPMLGMMFGGGSREKKEAFPEPEFQEFEKSDQGIKEPRIDDCNLQPPGFDPPPGGPNPLASLPNFDGAVFVQFNQPVDVKQLQQKLPPLQALQQADFQGKSIWLHSEIPAAGGLALYQADPRTFVITLKNDLADIFNSPGQSALSTEALAQGSGTDFAFMINLQPLEETIEQAVKQLPFQAQLVASMLQRFQGLSLFVDTNSGVDVAVNINTKDEQAAQMIQQQLASVTTDERINGLLDQSPEDLGEENRAEAEKLLQAIKGSLKSEAEGTKYHLNFRIPETAPATILKIQKDVEKRAMGRNNLKEIGIALLNYHETFTQFPFPAAEGPDGKRSQLSWRVHILPYVDHYELYEQFKLDEPWDSEHNKALIDKMPDIYKLSDQAKVGHSQLVAPAGKGFIMDGEAYLKFRDITDGSSNTVVVFSVKPEKAVPWTKPGGFPTDPAKGSEYLQSDKGKFLALYADGSVHKLPTQIDAETLKALFTIAGGEPVQIPE